MQPKSLISLGLLINENGWWFIPKIWCCTNPHPPPHHSKIRLSRVGDSFLENVCGQTVMLQIPWSAKYENENFEKAFPFYRA